MDTIRVGMIGVGGMAQGHIRNLLKLPEVQLVGMADISEVSLDKTKANHDGAVADLPCYADYRKMLDAQKPDAVVVCTPHTLHFAQAMDCLDSGTHVLLEKPMVTRVPDAHTLMAKIAETGKILALGYQKHLQPEFRYIREKIASGEFGAVQAVTALQQQGWAKGTVGSWRQDPALSGGGQINDSGSHIVDILLWATGLAPNKVSAFMDNRGTPVDINTALTVQFVGGAQGAISVIGDAAGWYEDITIWCEQGSFYVRNGGGFQVQGTDGKLFTPAPADMPAGSDVDTNFIHAIGGTETIGAAPLDGLHTIEMTEAAWQSASAGGTLTPVTRA